MAAWLVAAVLSTMTGGASASNDYTLAYHRSVQERTPLVVVVGADWCPACTALKSRTISTMERNGDFDDVSVAVVDRDANPELARKLMRGESRIPQILVFARGADGRWERQKLTGFQSPRPIRSLIRRAISLNRG